MNSTDILLAGLYDAKNQKTNLRKVESLKSSKRDLDMQVPGMFDSYIKHVLDPGFNYYMTAKGIPVPFKASMDLGAASDMGGLITMLDTLHTREVTGGDADLCVASWLYRADPGLRALFGIAIDRQLPGGIGRTLVNSAVPGLIYKQPYPGVNAWDVDKANKMFARGRVVWQPKMDGMALMIDTGTREVRTRAGQDVGVQMAPYLDPLFWSFPPGYVLFVEANIWDEKYKALLPRPKSNGIFNAIFKSGRQIKPRRIELTGLDMIDESIFYTGSGGPGVMDRYLNMVDLISDYQTSCTDEKDWVWINAVDCLPVQSMQMAREKTQRVIANGGEGGILKHADAGYKNGKSGLKMKNEFECTLLVIGWKPHNKIPGAIGSLRCVSDDNEIDTYVGSGLNEIEGDDLCRLGGYDRWHGLRVEVKAEKISKNNALDLPRIVEIRRDKERADNFEEVKAALADSQSINNC